MASEPDKTAAAPLGLPWWPRGGGRASQYEEEIGNASATAVNEMCARAQAMGANAVVGVKVDYFTAGANNGMLAAIATGTAVIL